VFGLGLIMSRFSAQGPMAEFREGPFRLAVHAMGVYSETPETAVAPVSLVDAAAGNAGKKASENRGSRNLVTFLLAPLFKIVFSEKKRRRKLARVLLAEQVRPWSFPKSATHRGGPITGDCLRNTHHEILTLFISTPRS
jgi:hypothetical protein